MGGQGEWGLAALVSLEVEEEAHSSLAEEAPQDEATLEVIADRRSSTEH